MAENQQEVQKAVDIAVKFTEISGQLKSIEGKIENILADMKTKHEEMSIKIDKSEAAIFAPNEGLYARVQQLENWKSTMSKVVWTISTVIIGSAVAFMFDLLKK